MGGGEIMAISDQQPRVRLSVDLEPELRRKIKVAAARKDLSMRDYVVTTLQRAIAQEERDSTLSVEGSWSRISARSFARDWNSPEDEEYDRLS
jgi:hypothetical protein